jgi:DNA polymerase elongation subunit (family B)
MIVNYEYLNGKLVLSYIDKKGNIKFKNYNWQSPLQWNMCSDNDISKSDKFCSWDNKAVKLESCRYPNRYTIYEFLNKLDQAEKDEIFAYNEPKIFFCDIETEITEGFPEAHLADNKVTSLCFIHENKVLLTGIKYISPDEIIQMEKDMNKYFEKFETKYTIEWYYCETEYEMLSFFFNDLINKMPVLTGWNFVDFDWVYLVTRARKLGINPDVASPTGKLIKPWKKNAGPNFKPSFEELPKHRLILDYMAIFDKWDTSIKIKESNALNFISENVLGVKKLEYAGNLKDLYTNDYYKFLLYNCIDTALVQLIHFQQRIFDIMLSISNLARIPIEDSVSAIRVTEGVFFEKYYNNGIVMVKQKNAIFTSSDEENDIDELSGGYVKFPSVGLMLWISVFDFASLYPTIMRQFNIAPEAFRGIKFNDTEALLNGVKYTIEENDIVLLNGAVFKNDESETKKILTNIFKDRKINKNLGFDYKKQEQLIKKYLLNRKQLA